MQTANIMLALGGDTGNTIPKYGVTPAEVAVLRAIHGDEAVFDIEPADDVDRTNREELNRLNLAYAGGRLFGTDVRAVSALFPGAAARVFEKFDELEIDESSFKAETRVKLKSAPAEDAPKAARGKKGAAKTAEQAEGADPAPKSETPAAEADGIADMDDKSAFG